MKCEIHNIEMKWEGSLVKGSMKCPSCAESHGLQDYEECVMESIMPTTAPSLPSADDQAKAAYIRSRVHAVDLGLKNLWKGTVRSMSCPYCGQAVSKGTEMDHYASYTACSQNYVADKLAC